MNVASSSTGGSSRRKADSDPGQEWENHMIMRFPPEIAQKIREYLDEDAHHGNDSRLNLSVNSDLRTGAVKFGKHEMQFSLYDLPCITEVMKTLDNETIYKVADVSQIIVCSPPGEKVRPEFSGQQQTTDENSEEKRVDHEIPHGLCPPMRNARRKRFRKINRKKYMDAADVERELKRLLRSDLEAVSVRWEVVSSADEPEKTATEMQPESSEEGTQQGMEDTYEGGLSLSESDEDDLQ